MLSVALCTFNGERYIREQLQSILDQTMPVDEIVVCDDGSTDDTLDIIESLKNTTPIDIRIYRNKSQFGVCANFQQAINLCHGDVIFLSDQDDVWHPNKTEVILNYFSLYQNHYVVFTDGNLIDSEGVPIGKKRLWEAVGMTPKAVKSIQNNSGIELFAIANRATGATMALRRTFRYRPNLVSFCSPHFLHDYALSLLALNDNQLGAISECLIDYRIHSTQQVGLGVFLHTPLTDDLYSSMKEDVFLSGRRLPEPSASRIDFMKNRFRHRNKAAGLFLILVRASRYVGFYHIKGLSIMLMDVSVWGGNMFRRLFKR